MLSNQFISANKQTIFKDKLPLIFGSLDVPLHLFAAFARDEYRKPAPGMWKAYVEQFNDGIAIGERVRTSRSCKAQD